MQASMINIHAMMDGCKVLSIWTCYRQCLISLQVDLTFETAPLDQHALQAFHSFVDKAFIASFSCIYKKRNCMIP